MNDLLFLAACLLTAVGVISLVTVLVMHAVTNHRILLKMLRKEPVQLDIDEQKYERLSGLVPLDGVDHYLIKIELRHSTPLEKVFKRIGKVCVWGAAIAWMLLYNSVSEWWEFFVVIFLAFIIQFAVVAVLSFIVAIFMNSSAKRVYNKYVEN